MASYLDAQRKRLPFASDHVAANLLRSRRPMPEFRCLEPAVGGDAMNSGQNIGVLVIGSGLAALAAAVTAAPGSA
jgi:hypothetical protein